MIASHRANALKIDFCVKSRRDYFDKLSNRSRLYNENLISTLFEQQNSLSNNELTVKHNLITLFNFHI